MLVNNSLESEVDVALSVYIVILVLLVVNIWVLEHVIFVELESGLDTIIDPTSEPDPTTDSGLHPLTVIGIIKDRMVKRVLQVGE